MVESVNAVAGSLVEASDYRIPVANTAPSNELGKDAFLKLLVAQLKYQDPLEPSSSSDFIATTAQFTVVEKLDELTKQGANSMLVTSLTTASALVGREVTATQGDGTVTAVVKQSRLVSGEVVLETDRGPISLVDILSVGAAPATTPTAITPTTSPAAPTVEDDTAGSNALADPAGSTEPIEPDGNASGVVASPGGDTIEAAAPAVDVKEILGPRPASELPAASAETVAPLPAEPDPVGASLVVPGVVPQTELPFLITEAPPEPGPPTVYPAEVVEAAPVTDPAATETLMAAPADAVPGSGPAETSPLPAGAIAPADGAQSEQPFDPFETS